MVTAILTYKRKDLVLRMLEQLQGSDNFFVYFNGSNPDLETVQAVNAAGAAAYLAHENTGPVGGCIGVMYYAMRNWPKAQAVWICTDDTMGLSPQLGKDLYGILQRYPRMAAIGPTCKQSPYWYMRQLDSHLELRRTHHFDSPAAMHRVEAWEDIGGYDSNIRAWGVDLDYTQRGIDRHWTFGITDLYDVHHDWANGQTYKERGFLFNENGWKQYLHDKWGREQLCGINLTDNLSEVS